MEIFYSLDGGFSWVEGTGSPGEPTAELEAGMWLTGQDLPNYERNTVQLIVIPYDNDLGIADTSNVFALDNYQGQKITLGDVTGEQADSISITYTIIDTTADLINLTFEYLSGSDWYDFAVTGPTENISADNYTNSVIWMSANDLPGLELPSLMVRCIPDDGWNIGTIDTITFYLDNNQLSSLPESFGDLNNLNDLKGLGSPTTENIAIWIWNELINPLNQLIEVSVFENDLYGCTYKGD